MTYVKLSYGKKVRATSDAQNNNMDTIKTFLF